MKTLVSWLTGALVAGAADRPADSEVEAGRRLAWVQLQLAEAPRETCLAHAAEP